MIWNHFPRFGHICQNVINRFMHNIYCDVARFVPPHGIHMNHHGGGMGIADKELLYPLFGNKVSLFLHHKELRLDNEEHHSTIVSPSLIFSGISN